jgi:hypothetical protein
MTLVYVSHKFGYLTNSDLLFVKMFQLLLLLLRRRWQVPSARLWIYEKLCD